MRDRFGRDDCIPFWRTLGELAELITRGVAEVRLEVALRDALWQKIEQRFPVSP